MDTTKQFQQKSNNLLIGLFVLICFGAVVFYWLVALKSLYHTLAAIILSYLVLWGVIFLLSNASRTEKVIQFLLTTGSFALTVGFIELLVVAQVVDFRTIFRTDISEPWRHPDNLNDSKLLHIHRPYDHFVWEGIEYRYDRNGFRNDTDLEAADLIVVGDSFVEGWNVPTDELLTNHLARQLDRPVANLGQSWYGPQQELEVLQRYGVGLVPKVCVWVFFEGNDLYDMHRYKEATQDWEMYSKDFHSFRQRSFMKNAVIAINSNHRQKVPWWMNRPKEKSGIFKLPTGQEIRLYFNYNGYHLSENDRIALEELPLLLIQGQKLCNAVGAKFLLVFAPTKFRVYRDFMEFDTHSLPKYWVINNIPKIIEGMVHNVIPDGEFLDLTTAFVEQAKQESLLYLDSDSHWSPEGHRVAASAIANVVRQWE